MAWFRRTQFSRVTRFEEAQFSGNAEFREAQFLTSDRWGPLVCKERVDLSGAVFGRRCDVGNRCRPGLMCADALGIDGHGASAAGRGGSRLRGMDSPCRPHRPSRPLHRPRWCACGREPADRPRPGAGHLGAGRGRRASGPDRH
nr:pentapeptide repeat-containing protein [Streptomyces hydrogenans]